MNTTFFECLHLASERTVRRTVHFTIVPSCSTRRGLLQLWTVTVNFGIKQIVSNQIINISTLWTVIQNCNKKWKSLCFYCTIQLCVTLQPNMEAIYSTVEVELTTCLIRMVGLWTKNKGEKEEKEWNCKEEEKRSAALMWVYQCTANIQRPCNSRRLPEASTEESSQLCGHF